MRTVIYNLVANPDSYNRVYEELLAEEAKSNLSRPFPRWREIKDLPYLDACINEAVRLHPPFSLPLERVVPDGGIIICGKYFPSGTVVGMNPYVVNRHVSTFGEDAHFWRPERWLIKDVDQRRRLDASIMTVSTPSSPLFGDFTSDPYIVTYTLKKHSLGQGDGSV